MSRNLTFPNLGIELNFSRVAFSIGSINIYWYAICIGLGFILAVIYCFRRAKKFGVDIDRLIDVVIGGFVGGIIGARAMYVITSWDQFAGDPISVFYIWNGGLAIYGGIIGGVLVGVLIARWRKLDWRPVLDIAGLGFLIGQGIGRWGNFFNVEVFGGNTNLPWGMSGTNIVNYLTNHQTELEAMGMSIDPNMPVHPTFLYESLWCILGFVLLHFFSKHRKFDGEVFLLYCAWYGFERFFIEGIRTDSLLVGEVRISQLIAGVSCIVALALWFVLRNRVRQNPDSMPLYVTTAQSQEILEIGYAEYRKKEIKEEVEKGKEQAQYKTIDVADDPDDDISEDELHELETLEPDEAEETDAPDAQPEEEAEDGKDH